MRLDEAIDELRDGWPEDYGGRLKRETAIDVVLAALDTCRAELVEARKGSLVNPGQPISPALGEVIARVRARLAEGRATIERNEP